jgi:hypothetical protein
MLGLLGFTENLALAKTGSYTISYAGAAAAGTQIRVTAQAQDGTTYDQTFTFNGQNQTTARDTILTDLTGAGWSATANGADSIIITGRTPGNGSSPIKHVDIGDNKDTVTTTCDGNVTISEALPGAKDFKFSCLAPNADNAQPGSIRAVLNAITAQAALAAGDSPSIAAQKLATALTGQGLVVTLVGSEITLDWENATNAALLTSPLHLELSVPNGAGGPHVQLELPDIVVPPIPTVSEWGLIVMTLLLLIAATIIFARRRVTAVGTA